MTTRRRPHIHARDHEHGGADVTRIHYEDVGDSGGGGSGGIVFDEYNVGDWFSIRVTDSAPLEELPTGTAERGIRLQGGSAADMELITTGSNSILILSSGDIVVNAGSGSSRVIINAEEIDLQVGAVTALKITSDGHIHGKASVGAITWDL